MSNETPPEQKSASSPSRDSEASPLSWLSPRFFLAVWGMAVATYIALFPMLELLRQAVADRSWWALGAACLLLLPVLAAFWPTSLPALAALVEAPGKLVSAIRDLIPGSKK